MSARPIRSPFVLCRALADCARGLNADTLATLAHERGLHRTGPTPVTDLYNVFHHDLTPHTEDAFADAYAQTVVYGLLAARWMARDANTPFTLVNVPGLLPSTSPFLATLFQRLIAVDDSSSVGARIQDLVTLLQRVPMDSMFSDADPDPVIHFYEDFLDAYDPTLRSRRGVYYTPDSVVRHMVDSVHTHLIESVGLPLGLADTTSWAVFAKQRGIDVPEGVDPTEPFVQILDPATGTGTFVKCVIERVHQTMMDHWAELPEDERQANWCDYVAGRGTWAKAGLLDRVHAFEVMLAPYVVAHLRIGLALEDTGFVFDKDHRLQVVLTNALERSPECASAVRSALATEAELADTIKHHVAISVVLGNPPYDRVRAAEGERFWVLNGAVPGRAFQRSLFDDILDVARAHTKFSHHASLYNLYVYFWRWALWRTFEMRPDVPGIVSFITPSSWLSGPGFVGLRQRARSVADTIWVVDVGGDNKSATPDPNIFDIETPVAIATVLNTGMSTKARGCVTQYCKVEGHTADEKLGYLDALNQTDTSQTEWSTAPSEPMASLVPPAGGDAWRSMPLLTDLFPWQQPGCKVGRLWPINPSREVLAERWSTFVSVSDVASRERLFDTKSTGRTVHTTVKGLPPLVSLPKDEPHPVIERYGYRSFDRQWTLVDPRLAALERPALWASRSRKQLFLTTLTTKHLGAGPAVTCSAHVPDLDYYCGRGGKDIVPLYRDAACLHPNVTHGLLQYLADTMCISVPAPEDLAAYVYALLAGEGYQQRFEVALRTPGPRVPLTASPALWNEAVQAGRRLLWLQTYAERFCDPDTGQGLSVPLPPGLGWRHPVRTMPQKRIDIRYDPEHQTLHVGDGCVEGVRPDVWNLRVSNMPVVKKWLAYRTAAGSGRAVHSKNPLDHIRLKQWPEEWSHELLELLSVLTWTLDMQPVLADLLHRTCNGPLISARDLPQPVRIERMEPGAGRFKLQ